MNQGAKVFANGLDRFLREVREAHARDVRKVAWAALDALMDITPIDTSEARTDWRVSLNAPNLDRQRFVPGHRGSTASQAHAIVMSEAAQAHGRYRFGDAIYLRNNAPHIEELEQPTVKSRQAPNGIIGPAMQRVDMETGD